MVSVRVAPEPLLARPFSGGKEPERCRLPPAVRGEGHYGSEPCAWAVLGRAGWYDSGVGRHREARRPSVPVLEPDVMSPSPSLVCRIVALLAVLLATSAGAGDAQKQLPLAPPGTRFDFEVIESHDAAYLGDTPGHMGRDGGLTCRPNVALGDGVFRTKAERAVRVGTITRVVWDRVSGGLTVEFDPEPLMRIAVGEEVWIDLNPLPSAERAGDGP